MFHIVGACPGPRSTCGPPRTSPSACSCPGDPHRALHVAQRLLEKPLMFNHHRGLWGYTGTARDGAPLTVQSTGMGGPSAAIVVEELIGLGARTLIRIGTCGSLLDDARRSATLVPVEAAIAADGASRALGADGRVPADAGTRRRAGEGDGRAPVTCVSTDLFYDAREELAEAGWPTGAAVVEMEAAAVHAGGAQPRRARRRACSRSPTSWRAAACGAGFERGRGARARARRDGLGGARASLGG